MDYKCRGDAVVGSSDAALWSLAGSTDLTSTSSGYLSDFCTFTAWSFTFIPLSMEVVIQHSVNSQLHWL